MRYTIQKRKTLKIDEQKKYILNYHVWLEKQRLKDKVNQPQNKSERGRAWLRKNKCPYCYKDTKEEQVGGVTHKSCDTHGLLQVIKD